MHEIVKSWLLRFLRVPPQPQPPEGTPESIQIFRAGRNYYKWILAQFLLGRAALGFVLALMFVLPLFSKKEPSPAAAAVYASAVAFSVFAFAAIVTAGYFRLRLDYEMRWYIVTDRSLRTRCGIWSVRELTMTFANIQEIRVNVGPLQRVFGLGDVVVTSAGGGGSEQLGTANIARFAGVDNANEIRDLMTERLRRYKDTGLGDPDAPVPAPAGPEDAARFMLAEARALRLKIAASSPTD
ncbi:MAG: PH domain-containing protein [Acidobacteria bacterium]|nr:PH domain-containing protein [Acidobacteriota bacterium]